MGLRRTAPVERLPGAPVEYQCVRVDDVWHATQEQASPPPIHLGGAWTICCVWATFTRGYERRRPTCPVCLHACERDEGTATPTSPGTLGVKLGAQSVTSIKRLKGTGPLQAAAIVHEVAAIRADHAAEEAEFNARLDALVASTKSKQR